MRIQVTFALTLLILAACATIAERRDAGDKATRVRPLGSGAAEMKPQATEPMRAGNGVTLPVAIVRVVPDYSSCANEIASTRLPGTPVVEMVVDENGDPIQIEILKPISPCIASVALGALAKWKFTPGTFEGLPVPVVFNLILESRW